MKLRERLFSALTAGLVAFAMAWGTLFAMVTALSLPVDTQALSLGLALGIFLYALVLTLTQKGWWSLGLMALTVAAGALMKDGLWESTQVILSLITEPFHKAYPGIPKLFSGAELAYLRDGTLFLGFFGLILGFLALYGMIKGGGVVLPMPLILVGLMVSMAVTDFEPDMEPLLLAAAGVLLAMIFAQGRLPGLFNGAKTTALAMVPVVLLLSLLPRWVPRETYVHPDVMGSVTAAMEELFVGVSNLLQQEGLPESGNSFINVSVSELEQGVQLGGMGELRQSSVPVMKVSSAAGKTLYLRGQTYGVYTGTAWKAVPKSQYYYTSPYGIQGVIVPGDSAYAVWIQTYGQKDLIYVPTRANELSTGQVYLDQYVENTQELSSYSFFCAMDGLGQFDESYVAELPSDYLELPMDTYEAARDILDQGGLNNPADIADYVQNLCPYSLTPEEAPEDQDFVLWFLKKAQSGYCVHYASTSVVLLRAMGYPARLATGYVCQVGDSGQTVVTGKQAHAWAEFYLDGYGWQVLESTPAEGVAATINPVPAETEPAQTTTPETTGPQESTLPLPSRPTEPQPSQDTEPPVSLGGTEPGENQTVPAQTRQKLPGWLKTVGMWALGLAGVLALILGRWGLVMGLRRKKFRDGAPNDRALAMYRHLEGLCRRTGTQPGEDLLALAKKARFSQHQLSPGELHALALALDTQTAAVLNTSRPKRLWRKFILCV